MLMHDKNDQIVILDRCWREAKSMSHAISVVALPRSAPASIHIPGAEPTWLPVSQIALKVFTR
jgi:hypothetical protein